MNAINLSPLLTDKNQRFMMFEKKVRKEKKNKSGRNEGERDERKKIIII